MIADVFLYPQTEHRGQIIDACLVVRFLASAAVHMKLANVADETKSQLKLTGGRVIHAMAINGAGNEYPAPESGKSNPAFSRCAGSRPVRSSRRTSQAP